MTTIRRLTYADLPQVIAIERRAFPAPWSLAMFVLELSKPAGICLAATEHGKIRGYLICSRYDTVWHIMNVAVDPTLQGKGIGSAMLTHLLDLARGRGLSRLYLETGSMAAFAPARALYASAGFTECGPFADYRPSPYSTFMTRSLVPA